VVDSVLVWELVAEPDGVPVPVIEPDPVNEGVVESLLDGELVDVAPLDSELWGVPVSLLIPDRDAVLVLDAVPVRACDLVIEADLLGVSAGVGESLAEVVALLVDVGVGKSEVDDVGGKVDEADGDSVADADGDGVCVRVAAAEADCEVDTVAVGVFDGVGRKTRTTMLSTRNDELPADTPSPLTTDSCSTMDAAPSRRRAGSSAGAAGGGSTALRRTHPVRPNTPTSETETLYSTVVVTAPDADVATAATCALSLRKSREANWDSHDTSIS